MLKHHAERAPLRRNVAAREVGDTALFSCVVPFLRNYRRSDPRGLRLQHHGYLSSIDFSLCI